MGVGQRTKIVVLLPIILLLLPIIGPVLLLLFLYRTILYTLIWLSWLPRGKDVLLVYSDSPIWHDYMVDEIMPMVRDRAVVLNWSERKKWSRWSLAVWVHRAFGGERNFNPLVVVFRPFRLAKTLRFWSAFKDWKHGDPHPLNALRQELERSL